MDRVRYSAEGRDHGTRTLATAVEREEREREEREQR